MTVEFTDTNGNLIPGMTLYDCPMGCGRMLHLDQFTDHFRAAHFTGGHVPAGWFM